MKVLSLFDGMSCGQIALTQLGIKPTKYYASEIDKYAIQVTQHNFPETIQMGDVTKWREWDIDWAEIDLIYGGSPCQGFSFAGKQLAFDDPRSALFFVFIDILNHIKSVNPNVKFMLENVRMKKEYLDVISEYMGVQPVMINSALVSAQNRVRYYWTNITETEQPEDMNIVMQDILEDGFSDERMTVAGKSYCLTARYTGAVAWNSIERKQRTMVRVGSNHLNGHDYLKRVYHPLGKSPTLTAGGGGNLESKIAINNDDWRKLTPKECERLQTVPDDYTLVPSGNRVMSNSQRYKMLGNGWTVEVIKHMFKNLTNN